MKVEELKNVRCSYGAFDVNELFRENYEVFDGIKKSQILKIESPLEYLAYARIYAHYGGSTFVNLEPQFSLKNRDGKEVYRVDFLVNIFEDFIVSLHPECSPRDINSVLTEMQFGIEIDSFEYHGPSGKNSKQKFRKQLKRARELKTHFGLDVLHFSGAEIFDMDSMFEIEVEQEVQRRIAKLIRKTF